MDKETIMKIKKAKVPEASTVRNRCDKLLTPIVKKMYESCLLYGHADNDRCTREIQVAHHHVHKGASTRLRYEISNLIPLCNHCHLMLHSNESFWSSNIVEMLGVDWYRDLQVKKREIVKADWRWYQEQHDRLIGILNEK